MRGGLFHSRDRPRVRSRRAGLATPLASRRGPNRKLPNTKKCGPTGHEGECFLRFFASAPSGRCSVNPPLAPCPRPGARLSERGWRSRCPASPRRDHVFSGFGPAPPRPSLAPSSPLFAPSQDAKPLKFSIRPQKKILPSRSCSLTGARPRTALACGRSCPHAWVARGAGSLSPFVGANGGALALWLGSGVGHANRPATPQPPREPPAPPPPCREVPCTRPF